MKYALALVVLVGCSVPVQGPLEVCSDPVFGTVYTEGKMDCDYINQRNMLAKELLEVSELWPTFGKEAFNHINFVVLQEEDWKNGSDVVEGVQNMNGVYVNNSLQSTVHEMFHVWEAWVNLSIGGQNQAHVGWDTNGRHALESLYMFTIGRGDHWITNPCNPPRFTVKTRTNLNAAFPEELKGWDEMNARVVRSNNCPGTIAK